MVAERPPLWLRLGALLALLTVPSALSHDGRVGHNCMHDQVGGAPSTDAGDTGHTNFPNAARRVAVPSPPHRPPVFMLWRRFAPMLVPPVRLCYAVP
jgi:hypothetical protein